MASVSPSHGLARVFWSILKVGIALAFLGNASPLEAASILTWTLQNVSFMSGQTATGSFTLDQENEKLIDWDIQVTGGSDPTLTNIRFRPGENCVVFCGRGIFPSYASGLALRTALDADNTFFEMSLYLDGTVSQIYHPTVSAIQVDGTSNIGYERLVDPFTVQLLEMNALGSTAIDARVVVVSEPSTLILFSLAPLALAVLAKRRFATRRTPA